MGKQKSGYSFAAVGVAMDRRGAAVAAGVSRNAFFALELVVGPETVVAEGPGSKIAGESIVETSDGWAGRLYIAAEASNRT